MPSDAHPIINSKWLAESALARVPDSNVTSEKCPEAGLLVFSLSSTVTAPVTFTCIRRAMTCVSQGCLVQTHTAHRIGLGRLPNLWHRTWHIWKNGPTAGDEHRAGLKLASERSNNSHSPRYQYQRNLSNGGLSRDALAVRVEMIRRREYHGCRAVDVVPLK
jgi:hypothetical protein